MHRFELFRSFPLHNDKIEICYGGTFELHFNGLQSYPIVLLQVIEFFFKLKVFAKVIDWVMLGVTLTEFISDVKLFVFLDGSLLSLISQICQSPSYCQ